WKTVLGAQVIRDLVGWAMGRGSFARGSPRGLLLGVFCTYAGIGMVWSMITVYATALGASATVAGAMISAYGAARLLVNLPAGIASERFGRMRVMQFGVLVLALGSFVAL